MGHVLTLTPSVTTATLPCVSKSRSSRQEAAGGANEGWRSLKRSCTHVVASRSVCLFCLVSPRELANGSEKSVVDILASYGGSRETHALLPEAAAGLVGDLKRHRLRKSDCTSPDVSGACPAAQRSPYKCFIFQCLLVVGSASFCAQCSKAPFHPLEPLKMRHTQLLRWNRAPTRGSVRL